MSFDTSDLTTYEENVLEYHIYFDTFHPDPHNDQNTNLIDTDIRAIPVNDVYNYATGPIKQEMTISTYLLSLRASINAYLTPLLANYNWQSQSAEILLWNPLEQLKHRQSKFYSEDGVTHGTQSYADLILGLKNNKKSKISQKIGQKSLEIMTKEEKEREKFRSTIEQNYSMFSTKPGEFKTAPLFDDSLSSEKSQMTSHDPHYDPLPPNHIANIPHLYGKLHYGENSDDLHFFFFALLQLSQRFPDISIHITENQQYLFLVDYIQTLPQWAQKQDTMQNRVWLRNGQCLIIPRGHARHTDTAVHAYYQAVINNHSDYAEKYKKFEELIENDRNSDQNYLNFNKIVKKRQDMYGKALDYLHHYFPPFIHPQLGLYYIQHYTSYCYISHFHQRLLQNRIRLYPYNLSLNAIVIPVLIPTTVAYILSNGMLKKGHLYEAMIQNNPLEDRNMLENDKNMIFTINSDDIYPKKCNNYLQLCYDEYIHTHNNQPQFNLKNRFENQFLHKIVKKFSKFLYNQSIYTEYRQNDPKTVEITEQSDFYPISSNFILYPLMLPQQRITQLLQLAEEPDDYYLAHIPCQISQLYLNPHKNEQMIEKNATHYGKQTKILEKSDITRDAVQLGYKITLLFEYMYQRGVQRFKQLSGTYNALNRTVTISPSETGIPILSKSQKNIQDLFPDQIVNNNMLLAREVVRQRFYVYDHYHIIAAQQSRKLENIDTNPLISDNMDDKTNELSFNQTNDHISNTNHIPFLTSSTMEGRESFQHHSSIIHLIHQFTDATNAKPTFNSHTGERMVQNTGEVGENGDNTGDLSFLGEMLQNLKTTKYQSLHDNPYISYVPEPIPTNILTTQQPSSKNEHIAISNEQLQQNLTISTYLSKKLRDFDNSLTLLDIFKLLLITDPNPKNIKTFAIDRLFNAPSMTTKLPAIPTSKLYESEKYVLNFVNLYSSDEYFIQSDSLLSSSQIPHQTFDHSENSEKLFNSTKFYHFNDDGEGLFTGHYRESNLYLWDPLSFVTIADEFTVSSQNKSTNDTFSANFVHSLPRSVSIYDDLSAIITDYLKKYDVTTELPQTAPKIAQNEQKIEKHSQVKRKFGSLLSIPWSKQELEARRLNKHTSISLIQPNKIEHSIMERLIKFNKNYQNHGNNNFFIISTLPRSPFVNIPLIFGLDWYYTYYSIFSSLNHSSNTQKNVKNQTNSKILSMDDDDDTNNIAINNNHNHNNNNQNNNPSYFTRQHQSEIMDNLLSIDLSSILDQSELQLIFNSPIEKNITKNAGNIKDLNIKQIVQKSIQQQNLNQPVTNIGSLNGTSTTLTLQQLYIFGLLYLIDKMNDNKVKKCEQIPNTGIENGPKKSSKSIRDQKLQSPSLIFVDNSTYLTSTLPHLLSLYSPFNNTIDFIQGNTHLKISLSQIQVLLLCVYNIYHEIYSNDIMLYHKYVASLQFTHEISLINAHFDLKYEQNPQNRDIIKQFKREQEKDPLTAAIEAESIRNLKNSQVIENIDKKQYDLKMNDGDIDDDNNMDDTNTKFMNIHHDKKFCKIAEIDDTVKKSNFSMKSLIKSQFEIEETPTPIILPHAGKNNISGASFWKSINQDYSHLTNTDTDHTNKSSNVAKSEELQKTLMTSQLSNIKECIDAISVSSNTVHDATYARENSGYYQRKQHFLAKRREVDESERVSDDFMFQRSGTSNSDDECSDNGQSVNQSQQFNKIAQMQQAHNDWLNNLISDRLNHDSYDSKQSSTDLLNFDFDEKTNNYACLYSNSDDSEDAFDSSDDDDDAFDEMLSNYKNYRKQQKSLKNRKNGDYVGNVNFNESDDDEEEGGIDQQTHYMLKMLRTVQQEVDRVEKNKHLSTMTDNDNSELTADGITPPPKKQKTNDHQPCNPRAKVNFAQEGFTTDNIPQTTSTASRKVCFSDDIIDEMSNLTKFQKGPSFLGLSDSDDDIRSSSQVKDLSVDVTDTEYDDDDDDEDIKHLTEKEKKMRKMMLSISFTDLLTKPIEQCTVDDNIMEWVEKTDSSLTRSKKHHDFHANTQNSQEYNDNKMSDELYESKNPKNIPNEHGYDPMKYKRRHEQRIIENDEQIVVDQMKATVTALIKKHGDEHNITNYEHNRDNDNKNIDIVIERDYDQDDIDFGHQYTTIVIEEDILLPQNNTTEPHEKIHIEVIEEHPETCDNTITIPLTDINNPHCDLTQYNTNNNNNDLDSMCFADLLDFYQFGNNPQQQLIQQQHIELGQLHMSRFQDISGQTDNICMTQHPGAINSQQDQNQQQSFFSFGNRTISFGSTNIGNDFDEASDHHNQTNDEEYGFDIDADYLGYGIDGMNNYDAYDDSNQMIDLIVDTNSLSLESGAQTLKKKSTNKNSGFGDSDHDNEDQSTFFTKSKVQKKKSGKKVATPAKD